MDGDRTSTIDRVRLEIERTALRARNGIKLVAGIDKPKVGQHPKQVAWSFGRAELWHYRNEDVRYSPPVLIIPSLVSRSLILDLTPGNSFVEALVAAGFDVYMLDWGTPDERDAANRFEDYVDLAIPAAIRQIRRRSRAGEVNLLGYCLGGVLALMHAAHNPMSPLRSLAVLASPIDFQKFGPLVDVFASSGQDITELFDETGNVPPRVILQGFKAAAPMGEIGTYINLLDRMWSDEAVLGYRLMNGWATDHVPFPGATARQMSEMLVRDNGLMTGQIELGGDRVSLADVQVPVLAVLGTKDNIVPEAASAPVIELVGATDKELLRIEAGHVGLVVGKAAHRRSIPRFIEFLQKRSEARE